MQDQGISTVLWRGKWIVLACAVVGVALAVLFTMRASKVYEASAVIQVNSGTVTSSSTGVNDIQQANQVVASTYAALLSSKSFLQEVRGRVLGGKLSASALQSRTNASTTPNTSLVTLTAKGPSPAAARTLAEDLANAFVGTISAQAQERAQQQQGQLQTRISALSRRIGGATSGTDVAALREARSQLQAQLAAVVSQGIQQGASASVFGDVTGSSAAVSPRPTVNVAAGLLLGLLVGVGLAWARVRLDRGLHSSGEVEEILDVPVLGTIPVRRRFSTEDAVISESFDVVRANLAFLSLDRPLQSLTITSYNPREGKSSTSEGLAFAAARGDMSVVLVDADVRTRTLSQRLGFDDAPGLTNVVVGAVPLDEALVEVAPGVVLLPAGPTPPNPPSLLASAQTRDVMDELRGRFSLIVIDSPPVAHLADATILASVSDGVLLVARVGATARADLDAAAASLRHSPVPLVGTVVLERRTIDETYYPAISRGSRKTAEAAELI